MNLDRQNTIEALGQGPLDVLVVGGGIVGAGVARDAAMRGLRVALVEQHDFAFGTSSRSSRLLHGGIRYLAQGRVGLVREASVEKLVIHTIAPHLAAPLPFLFPTYRGTPWSPWALWKLRVGVKLYDLLCSGRNLGRSTSFDAKGLCEHLPQINARHLTGAVRYFDGLTNDARLVIDTLRSAVRSKGLVLNYCRMTDAVPQNNRWRCTLHDKIAGTDYAVEATNVVNAAGPWAQQLPQCSVKLRLTKGVHLVIDRKRLPTSDAVVLTEGSRILFVIPWMERVILGTTDTDYDGVIEDVHTESEDILYILGVLNEAFPCVNLAEKDVISHWAGLRPLIADPNGKPSDISRAHEIHEPLKGWFDVAGGKLTTYRLMAEQTVDRILPRLDRPTRPCSTATTPLLRTEETDGISAIVPPEPSRSLVEHFCRNEWAGSLTDVMVRRSSWHYYCENADAIAQQAATWMGDVLGWDEARRTAELTDYRKFRE